MAVAQHQDQDTLRMSVTEYFEFEEQSEIKHEYAKGRVYAMSGAGFKHNIINGNIHTTLNNQTEDTACVVVSSDMRLQVESKSVSFRYPDTMVICGEAEFAEARTDTITNPIVIVEILSPSTALKDRSEKLIEYTQSKTLQEYVLVSQHDAQVEVFSRFSTGEWVYKVYTGLEASFDLPAIGCTMELTRIYRKVTLDVQETDDEANTSQDSDLLE